MLVPDNKEMHLGNLKFGQPYNFKYSLKNTSAEEVKITKLIVGCSSCTTANTSNSIVAPGESTDINVTFTPGSTGATTKAVNVSYTVGGKPAPAFALKFKAVVDG